MPRLRTWRRSQGSHSSETWTHHVVQPTQYINQLSSWEGKHLEKSPENSSEAETWFWWNSNLMCRWLGALLTPLFECFCPWEGQKLPKHDKNQQGSRHSLFECVYQIWGLYIIFKAMHADKWLWPIFGCKVGQSVPIGLKLKLDVSYHLLHVYTKFHTDIPKHEEKNRKTSIQNAQKQSPKFWK